MTKARPLHPYLELKYKLRQAWQNSILVCLTWHLATCFGVVAWQRGLVLRRMTAGSSFSVWRFFFPWIFDTGFTNCDRGHRSFQTTVDCPYSNCYTYRDKIACKIFTATYVVPTFLSWPSRFTPAFPSWLQLQALQATTARWRAVAQGTRLQHGFKEQTSSNVFNPKLRYLLAPFRGWRGEE